MPHNQSYGYGQIQKQIQKFAMTQQMQQSIQILRYSTEDLAKYLKQKQLDNPFVSIKETMNYTGNSTDLSNAKVSQLDMVTNNKSQSLYDYLLSQVHLTMRKTNLRSWVIYLIGQLDENGYLKVDLEGLIRKTGVDYITMMDAMTLLQQLDPPGVGARSLKECLLLQIQNIENAPIEAQLIIENEFESLVEQDWDKIAADLSIDREKVLSVVEFIKRLTPAPGAAFEQENVGYVYPDLIIKKIPGTSDFNIKPTKKTKPLVVFKQDYYNKFATANEIEVKKFLKEKQKDFQELIRDIELRAETIVRVAEVIIERQHEFFEKGDKQLKPLLLRDVAQKLNLHESTISRAVNGKYLRCDSGVYELKYFFRRPVNSMEQDISVDTIKKHITVIVAAEDQQKPLSDVKIATKLEKVGIKISRRTVAKYREELKIGSSTQRKKI
ncbi:MAG: RNA polymerase factor sigma-54 [Liquorilactobacillus mali]|uniref:RNA polymerase factor sigma-54 n=1 Tax=Liquorilactobacillus mali TaxID=1618 RepID=UPI0039E7E2B9